MLKKEKEKSKAKNGESDRKTIEETEEKKGNLGGLLPLGGLLYRLCGDRSE